MHRRVVVTMLAVIFVVCGLNVKNALATSDTMVISQVQLGTSASASYEFVELYNNNVLDIDVTDWCLYYASASSTTIGSRMTCFTVDHPSLHLYVPTHAYVFIVSNQLSLASPLLGSDAKFSATLSGTAGHVRIIDNMTYEVDKVGWGTATTQSPETTETPTPINGTPVLARKQINTTSLQDTDNNSADFERISPRLTYAYGSIYEVQDMCMNMDGVQELSPAGYVIDGENCTPEPIDICTNIDGMQVTLPSAYEFDIDGSCQPDVCSNVIGLQVTIPDGKESDESGGCVDPDMCTNLSGIQSIVPNGFVIEGINCFRDLLPVTISELFANADGTDDGHEFIELYNPNEVAIDLSFYRLHVGIDGSKVYAFPSGSYINPLSYIVFSNDDIPYTLVNTISQVLLRSDDGKDIDQSEIYENPDDAHAWAMISGKWQYTNQPTPGQDNVSSIVFVDDDVEEEVTGLKPCAVNQYRHPETNRCRLLVTAGSTLTPCKDGQYRSEETNRCRAIATGSVLTPCSVGQERNLLTNRCRSIASLSGSLTPCAAGQQRNPETNRCRNVASSDVPTVGFAVEPIADTSQALIGWWALGGVGVIALGYAGWEWRHEITTFIKKVRSSLHSGS